MSRRPDGRTVRKEYITSVRVTYKFKLAVEKRAEELKMTIADYVRQLIERDLTGRK